MSSFFTLNSANKSEDGNALKQGFGDAQYPEATMLRKREENKNLAATPIRSGPGFSALTDGPPR